MFFSHHDSKYQPLLGKQEPHEEVITSKSMRRSLQKANWAYATTVAALFVSLTLNMILLLAPLRTDFSQSVGRPPLATSDTYSALPWTLLNDYFNPRADAHVIDEAWRNIDFHAGIVALQDVEIKKYKLPPSQPFPLDDSKKLYLINGFHSLHCLVVIYQSLARFRDGIMFSNSDRHSFHCVDALRQDTICAADGTPRYSGMGQPMKTTGLGQERQCRDWTKLEDWAKQRSACYRGLNETVDDKMDKFKFCPDGSKYNDKLIKLYRKDYRDQLIAKYGSAAA